MKKSDLQKIKRFALFVLKRFPFLPEGTLNEISPDLNHDCITFYFSEDDYISIEDKKQKVEIGFNLNSICLEIPMDQNFAEFNLSRTLSNMKRRVLKKRDTSKEDRIKRLEQGIKGEKKWLKDRKEEVKKLKNA